jgi:hypothetical protein
MTLNSVTQLQQPSYDPPAQLIDTSSAKNCWPQTSRVVMGLKQSAVDVKNFDSVPVLSGIDSAVNYHSPEDSKSADGFTFSAIAILAMFMMVMLCSPRSMPPT